MGSKKSSIPALISDNALISDSSTDLNRRQFLRQVGIGAGTAVLAAQSMPHAFAASPTDYHNNPQFTKDDLPTVLMDERSSLQTSPTTSCITPTIETRLFASSNVGANNERIQLALDRMACAGFKVENPDISNRQYLRFAGTDAQRASDLQNLATGAIAMPKLLLGVRGGYGAVRLLPMVDWMTLGRIMAERGTILAGFSDVTAIQCALLAKGTMSAHPLVPLANHPW